MSNPLPAVTLCVLAMLSQAVGAQGRTGTVEYENFTLDYSSMDGSGGVPDLELLSDSSGVTIFNLPYVSGTGLVSSGISEFQYTLSMRFLAQPGYQIVGYGLSGSVTGTLTSEQPPNVPGITRVIPPEPKNYFFVQPSAPALYLLDFTGTHEFDFSFLSGATDTHDYLDIVIGSNTFRHLGFYWVGLDEYRLEAQSTVSIHDIRFIVYTAPIPVPEPYPWQLLVAGLAPVLLFMRRRITLGC